MAEEQAKAAGGVPAAIETSRLVRLPVCGKTVEVKRWSYARLMQVSRYLTESYEGSAEDDTAAALSAFYKSGHSRFLEVAKLSVSPEHRDLINEDLDASDVFEVMEVAFNINGRENLKKAGILAGQFLLGQMGATTKKDGETTKAPTPAETGKRS